MKRLAIFVALLAGCGRLGFGDDVAGGDGGGGSGNGGDGGGSGTPDSLQISGCPSTVIIDDDFADGVVGPAWTIVNVGGYTVTEAGGVASIAFPASAASDSRGAYRQTASQSLTGTCAIAEVTMPPAGAVTSYAYLRFGAPAKFVEIAIQNGMLIARFNSGGSNGVTGSIAYDAAAHRFLRIRESASNYVLEAGSSLTSFGQLGVAGGLVVDPSPTSVEVGGGVTGTPANNAGVVTIERVILVGP